MTVTVKVSLPRLAVAVAVPGLAPRKEIDVVPLATPGGELGVSTVAGLGSTNRQSAPVRVTVTVWPTATFTVFPLSASPSATGPTGTALMPVPAAELPTADGSPDPWVPPALTLLDRVPEAPGELFEEHP